MQRYREYVKIYQEEEGERSDRWNSFLEDHAHSAASPVNGSSEEKKVLRFHQIWTEIRPSLRAIEDLMNRGLDECSCETGIFQERRM